MPHRLIDNAVFDPEPVQMWVTSSTRCDRLSLSFDT